MSGTSSTDTGYAPCIDCGSNATFYGLYCPEHLPRWNPVANVDLGPQTRAMRTEDEPEHEQEEP